MNQNINKNPLMLRFNNRSQEVVTEDWHSSNIQPVKNKIRNLHKVQSKHKSIFCVFFRVNNCCLYRCMLVRPPAEWILQDKHTWSHSLSADSHGHIVCCCLHILLFLFEDEETAFTDRTTRTNVQNTSQSAASKHQRWTAATLMQHSTFMHWKSKSLTTHLRPFQSISGVRCRWVGQTSSFLGLLCYNPFMKSVLIPWKS